MTTKILSEGSMTRLVRDDSGALRLERLWAIPPASPEVTDADRMAVAEAARQAAVSEALRDLAKATRRAGRDLSDLASATIWRVVDRAEREWDAKPGVVGPVEAVAA